MEDKDLSGCIVQPGIVTRLTGVMKKDVVGYILSFSASDISAFTLWWQSKGKTWPM